MTLKIIGAGFGRTGTYSLKLALEQLGFGPCHHMAEVINSPDQIELWNSVTDGKPDYGAIFSGFQSAVDFPASAYWQDILAANPDARVVLSYRSAESWYESFSQTILPLIQNTDGWPEQARPWFELIEKVIIGKALAGHTDKDGILATYRANESAARALAAEGRALIFEARNGWRPLCDFLGVTVPAEPYPSTNPRAHFFDAVKAGTDASAA